MMSRTGRYVIFPTIFVLSASAMASAVTVVAQAQPRPESFFWAGVVTALVPVLILGTLGGVVLHLYLRERRSRDARSPAPGRGEA